MARKRKGTVDEGGSGVGEQAAVEQAGPPRAQEVAPQDLHARLRSLRPENEAVEEAKPLAEYLTFWIAGEECALPVARAREITRCQSITKVPSTPPAIRGVTSVRGAVIPVVDLAPTVVGHLTDLGSRTAVLLIDVNWNGEPIGMGLLVEAMGRVVSVEVGDLRPAPTFGTSFDAGVLAGLIPMEGRFVSVLDVDRALGPEALTSRSGKAPGGTGEEATRATT
jgi:purine-binding chemotaxis protein CheW